ncbi:nitroreductase [Mycobacteroides salmoniphilum]|uniref:Coenzyme F420:L-glutamate ligase n=1 Tax=Mycobacteroides salmoniphilum TaxID=404941 RepID=A0A4R8SP11_9MYCO|nr:nitroreductase [Mycobacteroides salmoniphilum]TDZ90803.1 Coenzyme F420:L-glutamate ligase [Mycobacteroides salmoniphilum]TEA00721.1 Coenzyme F420:L-glutamate ligase [Mycobacteroides salmoniphilum]
MLDAPGFDRLVRGRSAIRAFLEAPVPREILHAALETAQHAPSNSNIQPWRVAVVEGWTRDTLATALTAYAQEHGLARMDLPDEFQLQRRALGAQVYGSMGIDRYDSDARFHATLRNFNFFGAPTAALVGLDARLGIPDAAGVGIYLQTLAAALYAYGVDTCMQVAPAMFPEVVRPVVGFSPQIDLVCAVAIGYRDPSAPVNSVRSPRNAVTENVTFLE